MQKLNLKMKKAIPAVLLATLWISASEFLRNELFLKTYWEEHYSALGMVFPSEFVNGAVWGIWSLCLAIVIYFLSRKFTLLQTTILSWFAGFVMMWLVTGNMGVLPFSILVFSFPLSLLEAFLASFIICKLAGKKDKG